jgi:hypothetical protein
MCMLIGMFHSKTLERVKSWGGDERNAKGVGNVSGHVNVGIESVISLENMKFNFLNNNKYKRDEKKV